MNQQQFIEACLNIFQQNEIPCSPEQAEQFYHLTLRMLEINQTMNLTAITDENAIILKHYVDSATISSHIPLSSSLMDIGCGAGFPTLPLAILRPDLSITALDGTAKRIRYVAETAALLGLPNITAIAGRAEEYAHNPCYRERFDIVTARAVASLPVLCELCLPYVKQGGTMIAMKSLQADAELAAAKQCIALCGGSAANPIFRELIFPDKETEQRALILIPKQNHTPKIYPRHFSKISKKPL